jgi:hypothetical protein
MRIGSHESATQVRVVHRTSANEEANYNPNCNPNCNPAHLAIFPYWNSVVVQGGEGWLATRRQERAL